MNLHSWPNLFVVGAARAGTTSLWRYLGQHPEIFMARVKEPHFFSGYRSPLFEGIYDEASYLRLFASAATRLRGEASPSYLWSEPAAARIKRVSPAGKIVIALRDPVERAHSIYCHRLRFGLERDSFATTIARDVEAEVPSESWGYVERSRYGTDVGRFVRLFGSNVRVIVFEELVEDVRGELAELFGFLGVDPTVADQVQPEAHNSFALPRGWIAGRALSSPRARAVARRLVPHSLQWPIERMLLRSAPKPPLDAATDRLLTEILAPEVHELARVLGRWLPWRRWPEVTARRDPLEQARAAG